MVAPPGHARPDGRAIATRIITGRWWGQASGSTRILDPAAESGNSVPPPASYANRHKSRWRIRGMGDARHAVFNGAVSSPFEGVATEPRSSRRQRGRSAQVIARGANCPDSVPSGQDDAAEVPCPATPASSSFVQSREGSACGPNPQKSASRAMDLQRRIELARRPVSRRQVATGSDHTASSGEEREPVLVTPAEDEDPPGDEAGGTRTPRAGLLLVEQTARASKS